MYVPDDTELSLNWIQIERKLCITWFRIIFGRSPRSNCVAGSSWVAMVFGIRVVYNLQVYCGRMCINFEWKWILYLFKVNGQIYNTVKSILRLYGLWYGVAGVAMRPFCEPGFEIVDL